MSSNGHPAARKISTARSTSEGVLIPVEMNVCLPSAAMASRSSTRVIIAEATLLYVGSNERRNS